MNVFSYIDDHNKLAGALATLHAIFTSAATGAGVVMYFYQHWAKDFNLQQFGIGLGAVGVSVTAAIAALKLGNGGAS